MSGAIMEKVWGMLGLPEKDEEETEEVDYDKNEDIYTNLKRCINSKDPKCMKTN